MSFRPFIYTNYAQNNNKTTNNNIEIFNKQGFVEGRVFGTFDAEVF